MAASPHDDLLDLFRLEAVITGEYTIHTEYRTDRARGIRNEKVERKWNRTKKIGEGSFGDVWLEVRHGNTKVDKRAVKVINKTQMGRLGIDYNKELLALAKLSKIQYQKEEVLIKFFAWFENPSDLFISMEYLELGDLEQYLKEPLPEDEVRDITTDVLNGLRIMHGENFAHRDLKPSNIFVVQKPPAADWWVKIGDFGISKRVQMDVTALRTMVGTPLYMAPEITGDFYADEPTSVYDIAVDMWSLGCVVYRIAAQREPFTNAREIRRFCDGRAAFPEQPLKHMSAHCVDFVKRLMVPNPRNRQPVGLALKASWLEARHKTQLQTEDVYKRSDALQPSSSPRDPTSKNSVAKTAVKPSKLNGLALKNADADNQSRKKDVYKSPNNPQLSSPQDPTSSKTVKTVTLRRLGSRDKTDSSPQLKVRISDESRRDTLPIRPQDNLPPPPEDLDQPRLPSSPQKPSSNGFHEEIKPLRPPGKDKGRKKKALKSPPRFGAFRMWATG